MEPLKRSLIGRAVIPVSKTDLGTMNRVPVHKISQSEVVPVAVVNSPTASQPVYFSKKGQNDPSRVPSNSLIGKGVSFLSCDEKDVYINPYSLALALSQVRTPALNSMTPITVNYAADGFPRIEGKPWNGGKASGEGEGAPDYDPSRADTLISYGIVADRDTGALPFAVLGFRVQCRVFDTDLGASTVGIRVFSKDYDHEVINALLSVDAPDAEIIVPFFEENIVRTTAGIGDVLKAADSTIKFQTTKGSRDGSYNLVFAAPYDGAAKINNLPSFFTVTGQNVYTYVSPIMGTDRSVSSLLETLSRNPAGYLLALQNLIK